MCRKLSEDAWSDVCGVFDTLPAAAIIGKRMLCVHGGISPQLRRLQDINAIKRPTPLNHDKAELLTDLVWSDPSEAISGSCNAAAYPTCSSCAVRPCSSNCAMYVHALSSCCLPAGPHARVLAGRLGQKSSWCWLAVWPESAQVVQQKAQPGHGRACA